jgi:nitrite reductase/ring-hydroxylating ferredoxin subunit
MSITHEESNRREFLQSAGCVAMTLAALGLSGTAAQALPVFLIEGHQQGDERRYPIPPSDSVSIDHAAQLIVARVDARVYVFALSCPHQNNAVKWLPTEHRFQCTKHDSQYSPAGLHTAGRATRNLDRYLIRREGDAIVVDLHRWVQSDKDPAGWESAAITIS